MHKIEESEQRRTKWYQKINTEQEKKIYPPIEINVDTKWTELIIKIDFN